jgi:hypothetical protein
MPGYSNCDMCGDSYKDEHTHKPELCTPCWYIPDHIPESQHEQFYKLRYNEKSEYKKMQLLRQTNSEL